MDLLEDWGILVGIACSALGFGVSHYLIDTQTHASREKNASASPSPMCFFLTVGGHGTCRRPRPGVTPERGGRAGAGRGGSSSVGAPVGHGYGARRGLRWGTAPVVLAAQLWLGLGRGLRWGHGSAGVGHGLWTRKEGNRTERSVICVTSGSGG